MCGGEGLEQRGNGPFVRGEPGMPAGSRAQAQSGLLVGGLVPMFPDLLPKKGGWALAGGTPEASSRQVPRLPP